MSGKAISAKAAVSVAALLAAAPALAQDRGITSTIYGTPGLLEMPVALSAPEGNLSATVTFLPGQTIGTLTFQVTDRLSTSYRIAATQDFSLPGNPVESTYVDRSFDLRYRLLDEGQYRPSVSVGFQDVFGTGQFGAEYIVASKTFGDSLRVTAGLGWGRFGTLDGISNPLGADYETRPQGDDVDPWEQYFRGDMALFGGVEYSLADNWTIKAEYSSDTSERETALGLVERDSPLNFGLAWTPLPGVQVGASYLYGNTFGLMATVTMNPNERPMGAGIESAPVPVAVRPVAARTGAWDRTAMPEATVARALSRALTAEGIVLTDLELTDTTARVRYINTRYRAEAQAMGRVARILTQGLPPSIELITLEPTSQGIPMSAVTLRRTDLEALETVSGGTEALLARAVFADAGPRSGLTPATPGADRFEWGLAPYVGLVDGNGDPDSDAGLSLNGGAELSASYAIMPNLVLSGAVRQQLVNTASDAVFVADDDAELYPVRRNAPLYAQEGTTTIPTLTLAHFGRPAPNLYSRLTAGLLEPMYGGISTELLYKPVSSNFGVGAELNYVVQRDFDGQFAFRDYEVLTGHGSVYYQFDTGFYGQIDVGRYLAGDWGATLTLDRTFENGWRVGASATLTETTFDDMSEGIDYGVRITVPVDFVLGRPTQRDLSTSLGASTRDDGQRLVVDGRLYDVVRDGHRDALEDGWGRFWR
ncbi:YjbH domain-containing protein [Flavimaricola marinus]|nr:YjbH domain-containing protein [Flavimaricola marinus]